MKPIALANVPVIHLDFLYPRSDEGLRGLRSSIASCRATIEVLEIVKLGYPGAADV
jgi:hypothetical protein